MVTKYNDNFEVEWADPANAERNWGFDRLHYPRPQAPLTQDFFERIMSLAFDVPAIFVNNYAFMREYGPPQPPPEVIERGPADVWEKDYKQKVVEHCRWIRNANYDALTTGEFAEAIEDYFLVTADIFRLTTVLIRPYLMPMAALIAFCEAEIGPDGALLAARILQSSDNQSSAAGFGLAELTNMAASLPEVEARFKVGRYRELPNVDGGPKFLAALDAYLEDFGWRAESWALPHLPTWSEDRLIPLGLIARYIANPEKSPGRLLRRSADSRDEARREVESRLSPDKLEQFQSLVKAAANQVAISEERALWQLIIIGSVRVPVTAMGKRLQGANVITEPDDIWFLKLEELPELAKDPRPMQRVVEARRRELRRTEGLTPPNYLGVPMDFSKVPQDMQVVMRHLRGYGVTPSGDAKVVNGLAASKGVARGTARVLRGIEDARRLEEGDILICRTTAPPWTPLFAVAGAVVTDAGGILSHSAICAREYGIPAVVGTQVATTTIPDGATVVVDGNKGTVTIE